MRLHIADETPQVLRVAFSFPQSYPSTPLAYDLERSAKVSLKTRAFLLRNLARICQESAEEGEPSLEACVRFLLGENLASEVRALPHQIPATGDDESSSEDEPAFNMFQLPPPRCGASFGPRGKWPCPVDSQLHAHRFLCCRRAGGVQVNPNTAVAAFSFQHSCQQSAP